MSNQQNTAILTSRALVRIGGEGWRAFLQGLLSNDVEAMDKHDIRFAALLTPQGKLLFDLFVLSDGDHALLDCQATQRDDLIARLTIYRLRARVEIGPVDGDVAALWSDDPQSPGDAPEDFSPKASTWLRPLRRAGWFAMSSSPSPPPSGTRHS